MSTPRPTNPPGITAVGLLLLLVGMAGLWLTPKPETLPPASRPSAPISNQIGVDWQNTDAQTDARPWENDRQAATGAAKGVSPAPPAAGENLAGLAHSAAAQPRTACRVLFVYDGDTIACDLNNNGRIDKPGEEIRLLGIDTPEMHYSRKNQTHGTSAEQDEPFAREASRFLTQTLAHKTAYLVFDHQHHDKYGRTLAYVYPSAQSETSLCEALLAQGLATTLFIPPNEALHDRFESVEQQARQSKRGIWSL